MNWLLDAAVGFAVAATHRGGDACETTAVRLERAAELLRWIAAATRACP